jgi:hypothetical protein
MYEIMRRFTYLKRTPVTLHVYCSVCNSVCAKMQGKQWQEYGAKKKLFRLDENLYENPLHTKITLLYIYVMWKAGKNFIVWGLAQRGGGGSCAPRSDWAGLPTCRRARSTWSGWPKAEKKILINCYVFVWRSSSFFQDQYWIHVQLFLFFKNLNGRCHEALKAFMFNNLLYIWRQPKLYGLRHLWWQPLLVTFF